MEEMNKPRMFKDIFSEYLDNDKSLSESNFKELDVYFIRNNITLC